ncbi:MAG: hypothetical protein M3N13_05495 [Candidatus Eremiobacteraeota bacterium]|nr:hypothetical protein [Candidatus Eremiobacteraeota bacterium]
MSTDENPNQIARSFLRLPGRVADVVTWMNILHWERAAERVLPRIGAAICIVVLTGLIFRALLVPTHFSVWAYGDAQMFNAGEHFAHEGFVAHDFLPEIDPGNPHSFIVNNGPNGRYAHYPALHAIVNGVLIYAAERLGFRDVVQVKAGLQVVYLSIVALGLLGYFGAIKRVCGALVATLFTVFLASSPWVTGFGDSLCDQALNIALLGAYLLVVVRRFESGTPAAFNGWIALLVFLMARNSIELLPLCLVFTLFYGLVMNAVNGRALRRIAVFYVSSVVAPLVLALGLQFYQSYIDLGGREPFLSHWNTVFLNRVGVRGYDFTHFYQFLTIRAVESLVLVVLMLFLGAVLFAAARDGQEPRRRHVMQKAGFLLALALGFTAFPTIMPLQALLMQPYTPAYVYVPMMLLALATAISSGPSWWDWLPRRNARLIAATRLATASVAIVFVISSVTWSGLALLVDPLSVTRPSDYFWALNTFDRQKLAYFSQPDVRGAVAQFTRGTDILLFPPDFQGGDPHEVNPIIEFYIQRHGVIASGQWNLDYICRVITRDRIRLEGTWKAYSRPTLYVVPETSPQLSADDFARRLTSVWPPSCD